MGVDHGGLGVLVAQQLLNGAEVLVPLQQVGVSDLASLQYSGGIDAWDGGSAAPALWPVVAAAGPGSRQLDPQAVDQLQIDR
jgi:hypothetical protein